MVRRAGSALLAFVYRNLAEIERQMAGPNSWASGRADPSGIAGCELGWPGCTTDNVRS
ncbi:MAG: hypothetical protein QOJ23_3604 [Actinomycetota bacterium]|jgi:hypothetical protein|nr:hypothetical protein [Actinomycetota bacterium]MDT7669540.1 hypothetical protein [Pseudonocardiales bacterium]